MRFVSFIKFEQTKNNALQRPRMGLNTPNTNRKNRTKRTHEISDKALQMRLNTPNTKRKTAQK